MSGNGPEGWEQPTPILQTELFAEPRDRALALARVSIEDMERWRASGWISFDVREMASLDEGQVAEMCFIRNLAHSGLSSVQIARLLAELTPPYRYNPLRVAYSFATGWVQLPRLPTVEERDDDIRDNLKRWVFDREAEGDADALDKAALLIVNAKLRMTRGLSASEADSGE